MKSSRSFFVAFCFEMINLAALAPALAIASDSSVVISLDREIETLKKDTLALISDLTILEEELLFPPHSQISIFLSIQQGVNFPLSTLILKINDRPVAQASYSASEVEALTKGGIQRLYIGNINQGGNKISAELSGIGQPTKDSTLAATFKVVKQHQPTLIELRIVNSGTREKPHLDLEKWLL